MRRKDCHKFKQLEGQGSPWRLNVTSFAKNVPQSAKQFGAQVHVNQKFYIVTVAAKCHQLGEAVLNCTALMFSAVVKLFLTQTDNE